MRCALILAPVTLFLLFATPNLDRPGLHYDEALEGGLPAVQLLNNQPGSPLNGVALRLGGRTLPLMVQNHIGAAQVYAAVPFIRVFGSSAPALRAMGVVTGGVTIVALYLFMAQVYGRLAAFAASLWLATFASWIFWSRQGVFVTALAPCFAMCAFAAGAWGRRSGSLVAIALAGLFAGLAIYSKLSAQWLLNGMIAWWALSAVIAALRRRRMVVPAGGIVAGALGNRPRVGASWSWRAVAVGLLGLLLGMWPLLLYNLRTGGATLRTVRNSAASTYLGQDNTAVLRNLEVRLAQAADVLRSGDHLWYLGGSFPNSVALISVLVALLALIVGCVIRRGRGWRSRLLPPFLALMVILQSCFTISALWPTHYAIAAPLPAMIFGVAVGEIHRLLRSFRRGGRSLANGVAAALIAVVCVTQALTSWRYLQVVSTTGGLSFHSSSIYALGDFLARRPEPVVALDWGLAAQVGYLTGGRNQVEEFYSYEPDRAQWSEQLRGRFDRDELYITHATNQEAFPHREAFLQAVAASGRWAERVETFTGANGWAEIELWRVRKP